MKMWDGRFTKELDAAVHEFNASIRFDARMAAEDIEGSTAHAAMLGACGIISAADAEAIQAGLAAIHADLQSGALAIDPAAEDIHMFVEEELTKRIGDAGKRLHTARSRNDQVATTFRLYLRGQGQKLHAAVLGLAGILAEVALPQLHSVMPGYTHLQRAQPVTLAHHLMAYANMLLRDAARLRDWQHRLDENCPLGCGALAGTTYPINREMTAAALGFAAPAPNSMDGVADRDFCLELASVLSITMLHLSRFCEEIILWASWEFKFIELDDGFATGSSIMPQKKNPDIAELVRGKSGRVAASWTTLFTMLKGLPLAYNKDLQEDKEALFDAIDTTLHCLAVFGPMLQTMTPLPENMRKAAGRGFINATDCADYLTKKGMPFREAYKITGELVRLCIGSGNLLEELPMEAYRQKSELFGEDIYDAISLEACVARRNSYGGPAPQQVRVQIELVQKEVAKWQK